MIFPTSLHLSSISSITQITSSIIHIRKISTVALTVISLASLPVAKAGPIAATACFVACEAFLATLAPPVAVAYAPHCFAGCKIALIAPTP